MKTKIAIILSSWWLVTIVIMFPLALEFGSMRDTLGGIAYEVIAIIFLVVNGLGGVISFSFGVRLKRQKTVRNVVLKKTRSSWESEMVDSFATNHLGSYDYVTFIAKIRYSFYILFFWMINFLIVLLILLFLR